MNVSRPGQPALFNVFERVGLAILTTILAGLCIGVLVEVEESITWVEEPSFLSDLRQTIVSSEADEETIGLTAVLVVGIVTFLCARRAPHIIGIAIGAAGAGSLILGSIEIPQLGPLALEFMSEAYRDPRTLAGNHIIEFLLPFVLGLGLVCFAGEFLYTARHRMMREELRLAGEESEELERQVRRRQRLIRAALGPRMPVMIAVGRLLQQLIVPYCVTWTVLEFHARIETTVGELPASTLQSFTLPESTQPLHLRLNNDASIYLGPHFVDYAQNEDLARLSTLLKSTRGSGKPFYVILQVGPKVHHEWLIRVLSALHANDVPMTFED